jgi:muconolactone delta-isomerase
VVITAMPMISTKGLTIDDVETLKEQVRDLMLQKYREVKVEMLASLPADYPGLSK